MTNTKYSMRSKHISNITIVDEAYTLSFSIGKSHIGYQSNSKNHSYLLVVDVFI